MITQEQIERQEENEESVQIEDLMEDTEKEQPVYYQYEGHYDETPEPGINGLYGLELNDGLTDLEMQFAERLAFLCRGVMIVHGQPGCGKGTFGSYIGWKVRRIFKGKHVLLDYQPRRLFDYGYDDNRYKYVDADFMMDEVDRMAEKVSMSLGKLRRDPDEELKGNEKETARILAQKWAKTKGEVLMRDSVWELDELKRYLHNRHPNNRVGIQIGYIVAVWRHLRLLCLGMCPNIKEIDWNGFLQYVTHEVRPEWCTRWKPHTTKCIIRRKSHVGTAGVIKFETKPYPLFINGGRPRPEIGIQLHDSELALGEPEQKIIDALKSKGGFANLNEVSDLTGEEINECRLRILKMHGKYPSPNKYLFNPEAPLSCKCVFNLFNSLDYKNLNPKMSSKHEE
jgi:hypothetical protein